jgi:hypothetical protein
MNRPVQIRPGTRELRERIKALSLVTKAGIAPVPAADLGVGYSNPELFSTVEAGSIIGKMSLLRRVPFLRRLLRPTASARGYWVGANARAKPLSRFALEGSALNPLTVATIVVITSEAAQFQDPLTDAATRADTERANRERLDASFIDVSNAGVADVEPASVTNSVMPISSTGDPAQDVAALIENFAGDFSAAYFVTDPTTAARIALARDAGGAFLFPDCGPRGGSILNVPLITSRGSPLDVSTGGQLALVDASGIAVALDGMDVDRAEGAAIEMADDPDNAPDANTVLISLFQSDLVALRTVMHANWEVQRAGSVAVVTGCIYPAS